jgi:glycosyltransferase involved in cell wall biosynthesis
VRADNPVRVLLLTQLFQPEPNHLKGLAFAKAVREAGVDLRVLTGFPNYPGGRLYPEYRVRPVTREVLEGVPVTRVMMFPSHDRSALRRAATYVSFAASSAVAVCVSRFKPDIVHAYVGPMTLAIPGALARTFRGARMLLDIQDLWPESVTDSGMGGYGVVGAAITGLCGWAYRRGDRFVVLSEGYKGVLCDRGVPASRIDVIYNWCDESQIPPPDQSTATSPGSSGGSPLRVLYAGNVGTLQMLDVVLDAARILTERGVRVEFTIAGAGVELDRLRSRQQREAVANVRFLGAVPREAMAKLYAAADALLVHLRNDRLASIAIPQKTQTCLAAGRPVLMGMRGEAAALVEEAGAGVVFEPESAPSLAWTVARIVAMSPAERCTMGERGREFYAKRLSFRRGVEAMIGVYESLAGGEAA